MSGDLVAGRHGRPRQPLEEIPQEYAAFKIEQRGIDLIPDAERKMTPGGLFWLWAGAVFNVEFFFYGTFIMTFGLSVTQAVAAILIGNLFYALLGFASLQGPRTGTTAFMVSRAPFGQNGNRSLRATVNSDNPAYFGGYLNQNLAAAQQAAALTAAELAELARNSFRIAWLAPADRDRYLTAVDAYIERTAL